MLNHHSYWEIIVSACVYPCPCPYLHHHFRRLVQNSVVTSQKIPRRQVGPQYEPLGRRHFEARVDHARRNVPVIQLLSLIQLEKKIWVDHRWMNDGDDDDGNEIYLYEKRSRPRYHSRRVEST